MSNHLKGCGCQYCASGMHTKRGGKYMQRITCSVRQATKRALRWGEEPPPVRSVGYTD